MADDLIRRSDVLAELDRHAKGSVQLGGQSFRTIQLHEAETAINALPAATPTVQEAAKVRVKAAIAEQISEGIGAVLRKFCDSADAIRAREHLHRMPESDWKTLIDMLAEESASAALRAIAGEIHD